MTGRMTDHSHLCKCGKSFVCPNDTGDDLYCWIMCPECWRKELRGYLRENPLPEPTHD